MPTVDPDEAVRRLQERDRRAATRLREVTAEDETIVSVPSTAPRRRTACGRWRSARTYETKFEIDVETRIGRAT
jgi:hypothetical protein